MGFTKPKEQYLFSNLLTKIYVFIYLHDIIRGEIIMPGFFVSNQKVNIKLVNRYDMHCVQEEIENTRYTIKRNTLNKFLADKVFKDFGDCIAITEGVFLNKKILCKKEKKMWEQVLHSLILEDEYHYFDILRGNFSGAHYSTDRDEWVFYTNHAEEKPIFYYIEKDIFMVASELRYIVDAMHELNIEYHIDKDAFYNALTFGFMVSDRTFIKECKKLPYGCYMVCNKKGISIHRYYTLDLKNNLLDTWSEQEIIDEWDRLFTEATLLDFGKDDEYGYAHICELSGGIDSRMTAWVAVKNNVTPLLNISYTQTDSLDEIIAKKVSKALNTEIMVYSLNSGRMLLDFEEIVKMNYGLTPYPGIAHTNSVLKMMDFERIGAINTGTFGGVFSEDSDKMRLEGAYSQKLCERIKTSDLRNKSIENFEIYKVRNREFRGNVCSQIALYNYSEVLSPFLYRDFMDFYFRIPYDKRKDDAIYIKWIVNKYPEAASIPVERFQNGLMTESLIIRKLRMIHQMGVKKTLEWILWKFHLISDISREINENSMTPFDKWYADCSEIREIMDGYMKSLLFGEHATNLIDSQMKQDALELYNSGTTMEKTLVITALATVKTLFF